MKPRPDLPAPPPASLRLAIDTEALADNWRTLARLSGAARAGAAVKADAYGVGARVAVPALRGAGCEDFFVAHWSEAGEVARLAGPERVSVLHGPMTPADAAFARALGVRPVINTLHQAQVWLESGGGVCDLMVDTGMNRLGLAMDELGSDLIQRLEIDVLMSHLASADEDTGLNALQQRRWSELADGVRHRRASLANSAGIVLGEAYHGALTRPGLALYGGIPRRELAGEIRPVVRPQAALIQTRWIEAGESVGYNATYTAAVRMRVGVISLGYADGYLRAWGGVGEMESDDGTLLPLLGRVSMDLTILDLSRAPALREGDWVTARYDLARSAAATGLSQYELLTLLGKRLAR